MKYFNPIIHNSIFRKHKKFEVNALRVMQVKSVKLGRKFDNAAYQINSEKQEFFNTTYQDMQRLFAKRSFELID